MAVVGIERCEQQDEDKVGKESKVMRTKARIVPALRRIRWGLEYL